MNRLWPVWSLTALSVLETSAQIVSNASKGSAPASPKNQGAQIKKDPRVIFDEMGFAFGGVIVGG